MIIQGTLHVEQYTMPIKSMLYSRGGLKVSRESHSVTSYLMKT